MYYWDFYYPKKNNLSDYKNEFNNLCFFASPERFNSDPYGFVNVNIFSSDGVPINNALISVFIFNICNEYNIRIDAVGYYPVQINNIQFNPCIIPNLNVYMILLPLDVMQGINQTPPEDMQNSQDALKMSEVRDQTLSLGMVAPKDTVSYLFAEKFAEEVSALSNGEMKIDIYTDAKLGTEREMLRNLKQDGNIQFLIQTTAPQVDFMPKLSVFDTMMVYDNIEDLRNVIDNNVFYEKIKNVYSDGGYKLLGIADQLFRELTTNKEIQNIDDLSGIKIRIIQDKNQEEFWKSLGAIVIPLPISEIYPSLKHGFIDSQENPYENIAALKLYKVQKYVVNTNHLPHLVTLLTSDKFYNSLSEDDKAIIDEAALKAKAYAREEAVKRVEERKKILIDNGMTLVDLPEETKEALKSKAIPVNKSIQNIVNDDGLINMYLGKEKGYLK